MLFKRYGRAKFVGESTMFEWGVLQNGKKYKGEFLVFDDNKYGLGCVLFYIPNGNMSGQSEKWNWEFNKRDELYEL